MTNIFNNLYMSSDEEENYSSEEEKASEDEPKVLTLKPPSSIETINFSSPNYSPHTPDDPPPKKQKCFHKICILDDLLIAIGLLFFKDKE